MDNKKLSEKKQELMKPDWTENLHHELQELPLQEAKWIVENMTDSEIFSKVNNRRFQEDYIADYIQFLCAVHHIHLTNMEKHIQTLNLCFSSMYILFHRKYEFQVRNLYNHPPLEVRSNLYFLYLIQTQLLNIMSFFLCLIFLEQHYTLSEKSTSMLIHFPHEPQTLLYIIHCYSS